MCCKRDLYTIRCFVGGRLISTVPTVTLINNGLQTMVNWWPNNSHTYWQPFASWRCWVTRSGHQTNGESLGAKTPMVSQRFKWNKESTFLYIVALDQHMRGMWRSWKCMGDGIRVAFVHLVFLKPSLPLLCCQGKPTVKPDRMRSQKKLYPGKEESRGQSDKRAALK